MSKPRAATVVSGAERGERVQKMLAACGLGSRREVESWIETGRVTINGSPAVLGSRARLADRVCLDGRRVALARGAPRAMTVIGLNKPTGVICTRRDDDGRPTVYSLLPRSSGGRWLGIGRLDVNTSGLLLFTNHGELAHRLMHPRYRVDREYAVRVFGDVDDEALRRMREGVEIDGERYVFEDIVRGNGRNSNHWFYCVAQRGRNREVRRLWESQGVTVNRLVRVRFGNVTLPKVPPGRHFKVEGQALIDLCELVDLGREMQAAG